MDADQNKANCLEKILLLTIGFVTLAELYVELSELIPMSIERRKMMRTLTRIWRMRCQWRDALFRSVAELDS